MCLSDLKKKQGALGYKINQKIIDSKQYLDIPSFGK